MNPFGEKRAVVGDMVSQRNPQILEEPVKTKKPVRPLDYKAKLAMRRKAMKNYWRYIEECKRRYPGGSLSK
jgi:hypothetical protein